MDNSIRVAIIVPIYNVEKYVAKCIQSLVNQTYKNITIIAIDDGSPDNSSEIVDQFAKEDSRIRLIKKENGGYGSALEIGIQNFESDYFLICDPDDWLLPNAVETLVKRACEDDLDIVIGDKFNVYEENGDKMYQKTFSSDMNIKDKYVYSTKQEIQRLSLGQVSPHAKLYRTSLVKNIKLPHYVSYTDFELFILALSRATRVEYIEIPLAYYLIDRPGNSNTFLKPEKINDYLKVWKSTMNQLPKEVGDDGLLFRMFLQLKYTLNEYAKIKDLNFKDIYFKKILACLSEIILSKKNVFHGEKIVGNESIMAKSIDIFLLNSRTYKIAAMALVRKERIKSSK